MKNKSKIVPLVLVILALIISIIAFVLSRKNNKAETLADAQTIIKENYTDLSINVTDNIEIRKQLLNKINNFNNKSYSNERSEYLELLTKYDENVKKIDQNINNLDSRCDKKYEDATINIFCRGYDDLYEEVINIYVTAITNYNNKITDYNKVNDKSYELHNMIHKKHLDFNQDGIYQGK